MKTYCIDIDGVLVDRPNNVEHLGKDKYKHCYPIQKNIDIINKLYDLGHRIILFTARGMTTFNGNIPKVYLELFSLTAEQMRTFGVKHHQLYMGKPHYDLIIDDKALNVVDIENLLH